MKAAILKAFGTPLAIESMPDPVLGTGEVIVAVAATRVLSYANEVFSGEHCYLLDLPVVPGPGAIGRVLKLGPDAASLAPGEWVLCDLTVRSRDTAAVPAITLQGWSAREEGGLCLQRHFRHGSFAERMLVPTENAKPIGSIAPAEAARWCALGTLLVPYGGWLAAGLQPGETVLVSGATGNFGSAAVAVDPALGAACVVAPGRNRAILDDLARRFGPRVRTVVLSGEEAADRERMRQAAAGGIDCVLDLLPPAVPATAARAAIMAVRSYRPGGADGRPGAGPALSLDHAGLHPHHRPVDVSARGDDAVGRTGPRRPAVAGPVQGRGISVGPGECRRRACGDTCRAIQYDGLEAMTINARPLVAGCRCTAVHCD